MQRLMLAVRVFFAVLFGRVEPAAVRGLLEGTAEFAARTPTPLEGKAAKTGRPISEMPRPTPRSEALTLLSALQREARLVDIVSEPLGDYSDEQVGAAARDVLRDVSTVLQRMFELQPLLAAEEGEQVEVPAGYDPAAYRLTGNVSGEAPYQGTLVHRGWKAGKCEVPAWTGAERVADVVAAAEVEIS